MTRPLIAWLCWMLATPVPALVTLPERSDRAAGLAARVFINEDSRPLRAAVVGGTAGELTEDHLGILQVALHVGRKANIPVLSAFERLSPRVSGLRPPMLKQHAWTRGLPTVGASAAAGWVECYPGAVACHGRWKSYAGNWQRFRENVKRVFQAGYTPPCAVEPDAWGGPMDDARAISFGWTRLDCGDRLRFWSWRKTKS